MLVHIYLDACDWLERTETQICCWTELTSHSLLADASVYQNTCYFSCSCTRWVLDTNNYLFYLRKLFLQYYSMLNAFRAQLKYKYCLYVISIQLDQFSLLCFFPPSPLNMSMFKIKCALPLMRVTNISFLLGLFFLGVYSFSECLLPWNSSIQSVQLYTSF